MKSDLIGPNGQKLKLNFDDDRLSFMTNGGYPIVFEVEPGDTLSANIVVNPDKRFQLHLIASIKGISYTLALSEPFDNVVDLLDSLSDLLAIMIQT